MKPPQDKGASEKQFPIKVLNPETLGLANSLVEGAAEKLLNEYLADLQHARAMEKADQIHTMEMDKADLRRSNLGLLAGFVIAMSGLAISCILGLKGHDAAATAIAAIDFVSLIGVSFTVATIVELPTFDFGSIPVTGVRAKSPFHSPSPSNRSFRYRSGHSRKDLLTL